MKNILLFSLLVLICNLTIHAQEVYVDSNIGDDNNPGTKEAPVYSINKAAVIISSKDNDIYVAMNMHWEMHGFELLGLSDAKKWHVFANTALKPPFDIFEPGKELVLDNQKEFLVGPRSVVILISK